MDKNIHKQVMAAILTVVMAICYIGFSTYRVDAVPKKTVLKAYEKQLLKDEFTIGDTVYKKSVTTFAIQDINHDGIPEMLLYDNLPGASSEHLLTYYNGKIVELQTYLPTTGLIFYKKGSVFAVDRFNGGGYYDRTYYKISKGKLKNVAKTSDDTGSGTASPTITYEVKSKRTTKIEFDSYIKKITKKSKEKKVL